jgi:hypothetical protein
MPEISDQELAVLRRAQQLLDGIWNDKEHGLAFKRMVKAKLPDSRIPELDIAEPMLAPVKAELEEERKARRTLEERLDAREKADKESKEDADLNKALADAQKEYRLTDDGMAKVVKRMKDTGNPDPAAAAAWVTDHEPKAKPATTSSYAPSDMNLFGAGIKSDDEDIAFLHQDPIRWYDRKAAEVLDEFARGNPA